MIIFKSLFIAVFCFMAIMILVDQITKYLDGKPKEHKFRKWWSKNICDLDNSYN
jgi:hypothetical protein